MTTPPDEMEKIMQRLAEEEYRLIKYYTANPQHQGKNSFIAGFRKGREIGRAEGAAEAYGLCGTQLYTMEYEDALRHYSENFIAMEQIERAKLETLCK